MGSTGKATGKPTGKATGMGTGILSEGVTTMKHLPLLVVAAACILGYADSQKVFKLRDANKKMFLYSGARNKKVPHGEGTAWYATYKGQWTNGFWNKKGIITFPGGASFKGKFKKGKPMSGVLTDLKSNTQKGKFNQLGSVYSKMFGDCEDAKITPAKMTVGKKVKGIFPLKNIGNATGYYIGKAKKGAPHSKGTAFLVRYEGNWKNGKWDGAGSLYYPGGYVLKSRMDKGKPAFCVLEDPNKEVMFGGAVDNFSDISCSTATTSTEPPTTTTHNVPCVNCTTEAGERCQFPFTIGSTTYTSCTKDFDENSKPWCSTKVDSEGNSITSFWGHCTEECPSDEGYPATGAGPACQVQTTGKGFPDSCAEQHAKTHKNILFLGNSFTYFNDLPGMVRSLAAAAGFSASVTSKTPGGQTFTGHVSNSLGTVNSGDWDVVVLQGQSQRPSFPEGYVYYNIIPETKTIVDTIRAKNPCTIPLFFLTWGKRDGDSENCAGGNYFCTFEGIQNRLTDSYTTFAYVNQPAKVAPAGEAFRDYTNRASLFTGDGSHPSAQGSYLAACTMLETIWGGSCEGNSYKPVSDATGLQKLAHQTVQSRSWEWPAAG